MPINYWERGGRPTEHLAPNFLPSDNTSKITNLPIGPEYIVILEARSLSGNGILRFSSWDNVTSEGIKEFSLAKEFGIYSNIWTESADGIFYIKDKNATGDIEVKNIRVFEKPLGKATINGIDGFYSGKWAIHPNAKIIDNETLELNASGSSQISDLKVPVLPNQTYTLNFSGTGYAWLMQHDSAGGSLGLVVQDKQQGSYTFTTHANISYIRIVLYNFSVATGKFTFNRPILNLGTAPAPYEPKRGDRMVPPVIVKNLIQDQLLPTALWTNDPNLTRTLQPDGSWLLENTVKSNGVWSSLARFGLTTTAIRSFSVMVRADTPQRVTLELSSTTYFDVGTEWKRVSITANGASGGIAVKPGDNLVTGKVYVRDFQLEEGLPTPIEPYRVQKIQKAVKKTKNLVMPYNGVTTYDFGKKISGWIISSGIDITASNEYGFTFSTPIAYRSVGYGYFTSPEDVGKQVIFSSVVSGSGAMSIVVRFYNAADTQISQVVVGGLGLKVITTPIPAGTTRIHVFGELATVNDVQGINQLQLEITEVGAPATPFEPYKLQSRKAVKYPKKNLFKGFVSETLSSVAAANPQFISERELRVNPSIINRNFYWTVDVEPNTDYAVSFVAESATLNNGRVAVFDETATVTIAGYDWRGRTFNSGPRSKVRVYFRNELAIEPITYRDFQFEKGIITPYDIFRTGLKPARKGLEFNGSSDRMQAVFPAGTLDTIGANKDFTIESTFTINGPNALNTAQQTVFSCGDIRFGMSNQNVNNIGFYTPTTGWVDAIPGTLSGRRITLKAVVKPTKVELYFNGVFIKDYVYSGAINTVQTVAHIATLGGGSYFLNGSIETIKIVSQGGTIIDFDFTKPRNNIGTVFKANAGANGTIIGSPVQLNRQTTR